MTCFHEAKTLVVLPFRLRGSEANIRITRLFSWASLLGFLQPAHHSPEKVVSGQST
jgi:hypothetical protein